VVLALLSASILLNARLPDPNGDGDSTNSRSQLQGLRFGSLYFVAALAALFGGLINYDKLWSGMKSGRAFVQSPRSVFYFTKPESETIALVLTESKLLPQVLRYHIDTHFGTHHCHCDCPPGP
jgi:hypothetical protein